MRISQNATYQQVFFEIVRPDDYSIDNSNGTFKKIFDPTVYRFSSQLYST
jgi:hypothetical protein